MTSASAVEIGLGWDIEYPGVSVPQWKVEARARVAALDPTVAAQAILSAAFDTLPPQDVEEEAHQTSPVSPSSRRLRGSHKKEVYYSFFSSLVHVVVQRMTGNPMSLCCLYVLVCAEAGLNRASVIGVPGHIVAAVADEYGPAGSVSVREETGPGLMHRHWQPTAAQREHVETRVYVDCFVGKMLSFEDLVTRYVSNIYQVAVNDEQLRYPGLYQVSTCIEVLERVTNNLGRSCAVSAGQSSVVLNMCAIRERIWTRTFALSLLSCRPASLEPASLGVPWLHRTDASTGSSIHRYMYSLVDRLSEQRGVLRRGPCSPTLSLDFYNFNLYDHLSSGRVDVGGEEQNCWWVHQKQLTMKGEPVKQEEQVQREHDFG